MQVNLPARRLLFLLDKDPYYYDPFVSNSDLQRTRYSVLRVLEMIGKSSKGPADVLRLPCWGRTQVREIGTRSQDLFGPLHR